MTPAAQLAVRDEVENRQLRTLYELLAALSEASSLEDVYAAALASLLRATEADRAAILLFDDDGVMRFRASIGLSAAYQEAVTGHSPWARGTSRAQPIVVPDVLLDESLSAYRDVLTREGIRGLVFLPLVFEAGVIGKFMLYYAEPRECGSEELAAAQAIANHVSLATVQKRTELARHQSEQQRMRLAAIVESSDDAIIGKDLNGIITSWNKGAERMFGYTAAEVLGKPVSMLAAPGHLNEMPEILAKIRQGLRVEHYETRRRPKDGRVIDVDLTVSPVRDGSGRIVGASKIARDVTARKLAELERAQLLLREQEARRTAEILNRVGPRLAAQLDLDKLVQEVTDIATSVVAAEFGTFVHNIGGEDEPCILPALSVASREKFAAFGIERKADLFQSTVLGEKVVRCQDLTQEAKGAGDSLFRGIPSEYLPVRSYLAVPVIGRSGEVLGGLFFGDSASGKFVERHEAIVRGIAAQAAIAMDNARLFEQTQWAQAELKRSNEELRRANRDLEMFAYSASHDLQEPLRTIAISAQLIERRWGAELQGDDRVFLENVIAAARRMGVLLGDLLAYVRAAKHEQGPVPRVDAGEVLADVLESLQAAIEEAGATVTAGILPTVAIHAGRLAQLLQNLISNAIKYRGAEVPRVYITADERDGWSVFCVSDNGIGIEPQYAEQIFGLFKRLHGRDEYPGSGIGLALCQRVVEQYGGRIWLERSEPGKGSTFCFAIPA